MRNPEQDAVDRLNAAIEFANEMDALRKRNEDLEARLVITIEQKRKAEAEVERLRLENTLYEKGWESFARQLGLDPTEASRDAINDAIANLVLGRAT